ncbi:unnamed protein product [Allacma fusca]|uniref:Transducin beta-like protein 2 n=1 Tax=Allacma fusca TaxID=39272 RepID=A0A8J2PTR7_9HEXA|nr:unnamed protein product [Allacma fusca]
MRYQYLVQTSAASLKHIPATQRVCSSKSSYSIKMSAGDQLVIGVITLIVAIFVGYFLYVARGTPKNEQEQEERNESGTKKKKSSQPAAPSKKKLAKDKEPAGAGSKLPSHSWQAGTLKGHTAEVSKLDFSLNGKFLISVAQDRTALISLTKDFLISDHKQIRVNLGLDFADNVFWSPDSKAFLISKYSESTLAVHKLGKKSDGSIGNISQLFELPNAHSVNEIIGVSIASSGKFMLSASRNGEIKTWDLKGIVLSDYIAPIKPLNCIKLSSCGRFVGFCGHSPQVHIWSVHYSKSGSYDSLLPSYILEGHDKEIFSLDFNTDATIIVTADKAGTWRLFDATGTKTTLRFSSSIKVDNPENMIVAISHDSRVSAVAVDTRVELFSAKSGQHLQTVETHYEEPLNDIKFSIDDLYFVTAAAMDRTIKIFHNVCGYTEKVKDLKQQAKSADIGANLKERFNQEADAVEASLKKLKIMK